MSLYQEAWDSFRAEVKADKDYYTYTRDLILQMMERHLKEAKKKADEYRKKINKESEENRLWMKKVASLARRAIRDKNQREQGENETDEDYKVRVLDAKQKI